MTFNSYNDLYYNQFFTYLREYNKRSKGVSITNKQLPSTLKLAIL